MRGYTGSVNTLFNHGEGIYNDQGSVNTVFDCGEGIYNDHGNVNTADPSAAYARSHRVVDSVVIP